MRTNSTIKKSIMLLTCFCFTYGTVSATSYESNDDRELTPTPDEELIYAVKGIKNGVAFLVGMINPIIGLMAASYNPKESNADLKNIDIALHKGANIDYQEKYSGYTALIYAAYKGYPKIAAHLINRGANVEKKEDKGYNAYTMVKYYLDEYIEKYRRNEIKPFSKNFNAKDQASMRGYYQDYVNRYQGLVDLLEPLTTDLAMPAKCSWF